MAGSAEPTLPTIALQVVAPRTVKTGGWISIAPDLSVLPGWPLPQTSHPGAENYVGIRLPSGAEATLEGTSEPHALRLTVTQGQLAAGDTFCLIYGDRSGGCRGWRLTKVPGHLAFHLTFMPDLDTFAPGRAAAGSAASSLAHRFAVSPTEQPGSYTARQVDGELSEEAGAADWTRIGASENPPRVHSAYYLVQKGPFHQEWPVHSQFELLSVHEGSATFTVGTTEFDASAGAIILIKPFRQHATAIDPGCHLAGINICFSPGSLFGEVDGVDEKALATGSSEAVAKMAALAVDIMEESQHLLDGAHNCADAYLSLLLVECLRELGSSARGRREAPPPQDALARARIDQCVLYIGRHFDEELTLDRLAEELSVSPWHLSHIFSRNTGTTISAYITDVRMRRAGDLVAGTLQPLKEIASRVGYSDEFYFSKVFKRYFGMPPGAFRKTQAGR